jgi:hypothetical protein
MKGAEMGGTFGKHHSLRNVQSKTEEKISFVKSSRRLEDNINPLNAELNPI